MKKLTVICLLITALFSASVCFGSAVTNGGLTLTVPEEYEDLVVVEVPENDPEGKLFSVSEKESIEVAEASGSGSDGAGWLFAIGTVSEEKLHEMLCDDMSGEEVLGKDADGKYYIYYHPTDVRMIREDYSDQAGWDRWTVLNEWAWGLRDSFVTENPALTAEKYGNTEPDIYLARLMYRDDVSYTLSTTEFGPVNSGNVKAADYIKPLTEGAVFEAVDNEETPDGEYVVLNFPEEDIRFDFFFMEGKENYVRQTWFNGENVRLYKASFADPDVKASAVMNDLYRDMVLARSLGYTEDDFAGVWADKIAGRCSITITKADEGKFDVSIHWSSSAFETSLWTMTAVPTGNGAELRYEDCKQVNVVFTSETESTETVVYENGTGTFSLLSTYELVWNDETGHAADDMLFISAGM